MIPDPPACTVRVSLRRPDGEVVDRVRLCWRAPPSAADVLREILRRRLTARRQGLLLDVDDAPAEVHAVLVATALS